MDNVSREKRSEIMRAVRRKSTGPELRVRSALHAMGRRFRLHAPDLPGSPDIVFRGLKKAIFVHGCFWHGHVHCGRVPKTNVPYWRAKFERNRRRDAVVRGRLSKLGWSSLVVWECQLIDLHRLGMRLSRFLDR
jgi:DNA mismatch endonuclease, patch repair protein